MKKKLHWRLSLSLLCAVVFSACASTPNASGTSYASTLFGIRPGQPEKSISGVLSQRGTLIRREARQEAWTVENDPSFRAVIIGYDSERRVRFITAVAKPDGKRLRYQDVLDIRRARKVEGPSQHFYSLEVRRFPRSRTYHLEARGRDPVYLEYFTIRSRGEQGEEEKEE